MISAKPLTANRNVLIGTNWHIIVMISLESREFRISSPCFFNSFWEWGCMYECQFYSVVFWSNWTGNYTLLQSGKDRAFLHVWPLAVEDARSQNDIVERVLKLKKRNPICISTLPYSNEKNEKKNCSIGRSYRLHWLHYSIEWNRYTPLNLTARRFAQG